VTDERTGSGFDPRAVDRAVIERRDALDDAHCVLHRVKDESDLWARVAQQIAKGSVVGWFPDRAGEARCAALIDPRRADLVDLVREKLGERAGPFDVLVLGDAVEEWFVADDPSGPVSARETKLAGIPGVAHASLVRTVSTTERHDRPDCGVIEAFRAITGIPMVLAASCSGDEPANPPAAALDCFLRTRMDLIVVGNLIIQRV
jgi:carbamoyltransferase